METEIVLNVKMEPLEEGGFVATSPDLPGLVVQGRTRVETMELAQANARILLEVYRSGSDEANKEISKGSIV